MALRLNRQPGRKGPDKAQTQDNQGRQLFKGYPAATFNPGVHATVNGQAVRIMGIGEIPGYSPAALCVDQEKDLTWVSLEEEEVKIVDPNFLPIQLDLNR